MTSPIEVPYLSYKQITQRANIFLEKFNPKGSLPVPIEEIVEFDFGIDIVPIHGLHQAFEIDGFLSSDLSRISVDLAAFENSPGRYRFTLAHELGHAVLHRKAYESATFSKINEWERFVSRIGIQSYGWLEFHANSFAGLVLVPPLSLKKKMAEARRRVKSVGISIKKSEEVAKLYITSWLSKQFKVSSQVIDIRLQKDELWPP